MSSCNVTSGITMKILWAFSFVILYFLLLQSFGLATECKVTVESFVIDYVNREYVDATGTAYDYNNTANKRVNYTVIWRVDLPEDTKLSLRVKKWVKTDYRLVVFNIERRMKQMLEMDAFGIQTLCLEYTRPPAVWPLVKNVPYTVSNWYIDGSKFPPNLPVGKWLVEQSFMLSNKTVMMTVFWNMFIEYV